MKICGIIYKVVFMLEQIKENYVNICIASVYTILAMLVYGIWSYSAWRLWWVTMLIVIILLVAGFVISFFGLKAKLKPSKTSLRRKKNRLFNNYHLQSL